MERLRKLTMVSRMPDVGTYCIWLDGYRYAMDEVDGFGAGHGNIIRIANGANVILWGNVNKNKDDYTYWEKL